MEQKAIFLMGVAGSGKSTIQPGLLAMKHLSFEQVNTTTTRPMREGETQGDMYDFVSDDYFKELQEAHDFVEYALVHQKYYYGTRKSLMQHAFADQKNVLKQVDILGREQIVEQDEVRRYSRSVFMDVNDDVMRERMVARDSSITQEEIERRIESAQYEREKAYDLCDVVVEVSSMTKEQQLDTIGKVITDLLAC